MLPSASLLARCKYLPDGSGQLPGQLVQPDLPITRTRLKGLPGQALLPAADPVAERHALYRPYNGVVNNALTSTHKYCGLINNDPYQFKLTAANIITTPANGSVPATGSNPRRDRLQPESGGWVGDAGAAGQDFVHRFLVGHPARRPRHPGADRDRLHVCRPHDRPELEACGVGEPRQHD